MSYVGIDLGTTNSAICSYDGEHVHLYKSPDQQDVTPSAIFIDRRGNKYFGTRAYNQSVRSPDNAAVLFKRFMGTSTPIKLTAVNVTLTPEECSAEILRVLFGYLPEEIRHDESLGTVITVPAAFNQMQKDATKAAADAAGIGAVALMQEPVAAVMSVMQSRKTDGTFLIYDLGGGTLDVAIAESTSGRVNLLAHGGIAMCGGRDFDRAIVDNIVKPWLREHFDLPDNFNSDPKYKKLMRMAAWASENAKIALSQRDEAVISLPETDLGVRDQADEEIYLDVPINRKTYEPLIEHQVNESIQAVRETLEKAGIRPEDVERVVFVGGPTNYKPLRDKVAFELGIAASTEVNPMTAVAEGAAIFAESIDWTSESRGRKSSRGSISASGNLNLVLNYVARTPDVKAKIVLKLAGHAAPGAQFQIDSLDTGWSSGRIELKDGAGIELSLAKPGDNTFKVFVFDSSGGPVKLPQDQIVITRTAATIDAIPASGSIGLEVNEKRLGGRAVLDYLVRDGDRLPIKGKKVFHAGEAVKAGSTASLRFKIWEGEIPDPVSDNRFIGMLEVKGSDFEDGIIAKGAELVCEYEMTDAGQIKLEVSVPSIGGSFGHGRSFYSRQQAQIDFSNAARVVSEQSDQALERVDEMSAKVDDERLDRARDKLESAKTTAQSGDNEEAAKQAMDDVQDAKRLLSDTRQAHLKEIRQMELDDVVERFDKAVRQYARPSEAGAFDNLTKTAQRAIDSNSRDFEVHLSDLRGRNFEILWRQDWYVIDHFKWVAERSYLSSDPDRHAALVGMGREALNANDMDKLKAVVAEIYAIQIDGGSDVDMDAMANIVRG